MHKEIVLIDYDWYIYLIIQYAMLKLLKKLIYLTRFVLALANIPRKLKEHI